MRLGVGDVIYCVSGMENLTLGKGYKIFYVQDWSDGIAGSVRILGDDGLGWWFGQIGGFEPWDRWFVTETVWFRMMKLEDLGI